MNSSTPTYVESRAENLEFENQIKLVIPFPFLEVFLKEMIITILINQATMA